MNIPFFTRLQNKTQVNNARLQVLKTELDLENAKKLLRSDIETAQTNAIAALNRYTSNQKAVSSMKEAFRYSQEKFNVGMVNAVEYNTAKKQWRRLNQTCCRLNMSLFSVLKYWIFIGEYPSLFNNFILNKEDGNQLLLFMLINLSI